MLAAAPGVASPAYRRSQSPVRAVLFARPIFQVTLVGLGMFLASAWVVFG